MKIQDTPKYQTFERFWLLEVLVSISLWPRSSTENEITDIEVRILLELNLKYR